MEPAAGDEPDGGQERGPEGPSRTARKHASEALRDLGVELATLPEDALERCGLPEPVLDAVRDLRRFTSFGARRRQAQYLGKLMRQLDERALEAARGAVGAARAPSARQTALLHRAEAVRDALLPDDAALERWLGEHPGEDAQRLRALIRQARKDARAERPGEAVRRGRAYREIFAIVRRALLEPGD